MMSEQKVLRISIIATIILAGFGIIFGIISSSRSITFDGIYDLNDAVATSLALFVANLIRVSVLGDSKEIKFAEQFTMGFWHLEPLVLAFNGSLIILSCIYALVTSVSSILEGGTVISFTYAVIYTLASLIISTAMLFFTKHHNKTIRSAFIELDTQSWLLSSIFSLVWLIAFSIGSFLKNSSYSWVTPYIDPSILIVVCVMVLPIPFKSVKSAFADILLITPADLQEQVKIIANRVVKEHEFLSYRSYVAKVGRGRQIELYFIAAKDGPAKKLEEWDKLRDEIEHMLKAENPNIWLSIVFTTDLEWAE